jgi:hypothetical protein
MIAAMMARGSAPDLLVLTPAIGRKVGAGGVGLPPLDGAMTGVATAVGGAAGREVAAGCDDALGVVLAVGVADVITGLRVAVGVGRVVGADVGVGDGGGVTAAVTVTRPCIAAYP